MQWSHFDAVIRLHLFDAERWQAFACELEPDDAAGAWAELFAIENARELAAWGHVGPRGVG